jgi:hypothetical protein
MKKQLLLLVMMLLSLPTIAYNYYDVKYDGIYYVFDAYLQAGVTYYNYNDYSGDVVIPKSIYYEGKYYTVKYICDYAFKNCKNLTSVTIKANIERIGSNAFAGCNNLTKINLPNGLTEIGGSAFSGCSSLTTIEMPITVSSIGNSCFYGCSSLKNLTLSQLLTRIENWAFGKCTSLTSVEIPQDVTSIGSSAFYECTGLTSIDIPKNVTKIEGSAFYGCSCLTSIAIPNSVTEIGSSAFSNCSQITNVIIGNGVNIIRTRAFANCTKLKDVYCYAASVPTMMDDANKQVINLFEGVSIGTNTILHVPLASLDAYQSASPWKDFYKVVALTGSDPGATKCAKPTIKVEGGKLSYSCETEGITFKWSYSYNSENVENEGNETILSGTMTCHVSVYATKEGYADSDVATADVELSVGVQGDTNQDGKVTITDAVSVVNIILNNGEATAPAMENPADEAP